MATEVRLASDGGYDRKAELKSFDDSKAGVKGLADAKLTQIPRIFVHRHLKLELSRASESPESSPSVPVIDFEGAGRSQSPRERKRTVDLVQEACEGWGFFQAVNHGVPGALMEEMVQEVRRFHEQDLEAKREWYSRDYGSRKVLYNSNFDLYGAPAANWRDSLTWLHVVRILKNCLLSVDEEHDRTRESRAFDETKAGVNGLVWPPDKLACYEDHVVIPVEQPRMHERWPHLSRRVVAKYCASIGKMCCFFQLINHGVPREPLGGGDHQVVQVLRA